MEFIDISAFMHNTSQDQEIFFIFHENTMTDCMLCF